MLHLTKVAVGCPDIETLARLQATRWGTDPCALTRFMPKRADQLVGGSLFWIIRHRLVARQAIASLDMVTTEWGLKCRIGLAGAPIAITPVPRRAHQGWRYLEAADAPPDDALPPTDLPLTMVRELQSLWLL